MRYPPMASLVGFMFLDRQNVVADRDIQTPMGQMETAQIVYTDLTFLKSE